MSTHNPFANAYRGTKPWTKEADARLLELVQAKTRHAVIARELGRTITAIRMRLMVVDPERTARRELCCWTHGQLELAEKHLALRTNPELFHRIVGHTIQQAKQKFLRNRAKARMAQNEAVPSIIIPQEVLQERARRLAASPRDIVGAICGDPLPGYSALEMRR